MRKKEKTKNKARLQKRRRIAKRIRGTEDRPRLSVFRSARHIYAQVIDDTSGRTLAAASTLTTSIANTLEKGNGKIPAARKVGQKIAELAKSGGVEQVVYDRGPYRYHGRVKALAEAAREAGLRF